MEFCKTIKEFDCAKFKEGQCYYIHWHDFRKKPIKAIYLCDRVDKESNSISVKTIVSLQGGCRDYTIRFGSGDVYCIDEVQEVKMDVEYNTNWGWWKLECEIQPEIKEVSHQYNFIED